MTTSWDAPDELRVSIWHFWPQAEWNNAAAIAQLESGFDAFADNNTTNSAQPCGTEIATVGGVAIYAEHSVGYFQINVCNYPDWVWQRLWNAYQNAGTAHALWDSAGQKWTPWYESATKLGLI